MKVENEVQPKPESVRDFLAGADAPVVMVNLLRYRDQAEYEDGRESTLSGAEAYGLYAVRMKGLVERAGGRFLYTGHVESLFLGQVEDLWDAVGLVEYPSPKTLVTIVSSPEFHEIEQHRVAGLAGQLNIAARTREDFS